MAPRRLHAPSSDDDDERETPAASANGSAQQRRRGRSNGGTSTPAAAASQPVLRTPPVSRAYAYAAAPTNRNTITIDLTESMDDDDSEDAGHVAGRTRAARRRPRDGSNNNEEVMSTPAATTAAATPKRPAKKTKTAALSIGTTQAHDGNVGIRAGFVDATGKHYRVKGKETVEQVVNKLGCQWRDFVNDAFMRQFPDALCPQFRFPADSILVVPATSSKWRIRQLIDKNQSEGEDASCAFCHLSQETKQNPILLCVGCAVKSHLRCNGTNNTAVPTGDWFCQQCTGILHARRQKYGGGQGSLLASLPKLAPYSEPSPNSVATSTAMLHDFLHQRLESRQAASKAKHQEMRSAEQKKLHPLEKELAKIEKKMNKSNRNIWNLNGYLGEWGTPTIGRAEAKLKKVKASLSEGRRDLKRIDKAEIAESKNLQREFRRLTGDAASKSNEKSKARLLGTVEPTTEDDVVALNMLREPEEVVILLPVLKGTKNSPGQTSDPSPKVEIQRGGQYAVFALSALFDIDRDDELPLQKNGVRQAQRVLARLLKAHRDNSAMVVTSAATVHLRGGDEATVGANLFDLGELARDCNTSLSFPKEPTPVLLAQNGLQLYDYQQSALKFMLDKETTTSPLGFAGELWDRCRFMDTGRSNDYYYCELTGTFALNLFDLGPQLGQRNGFAPDFGGFQTGCINGLEIGLGKTLICLGLFAANPPPLHDQVMPREHLWATQRHQVNHPEYIPPPLVRKKKEYLLSNGTLVVAATTLISQLATEVEQYAPTLNVIVLDAQEHLTREEIASADVVIASTCVIQQSSTSGDNKKPKSSPLRSCVRRVHFHRILVVESHFGQNDDFTKAMAALSATHRHCVSGTPLGHSLDDLHTQLSLLRVPQFCREKFFQNNISDQFSGRNTEALRVVRSLLSRMVVRYSKEQALGVALPQRSAVTIRVPFGSNSEKDMYRMIEKTGVEYLESLRSEPVSTVANGLAIVEEILMWLRQTSVHPSLVSLETLNDSIREMGLEDFFSTFAVADLPTRAAVFDRALRKASVEGKDRVARLIKQFHDDHNHAVECPICLDAKDETQLGITPCGHLFCMDCISGYMKEFKSYGMQCPECRSEIYQPEITRLQSANDTDGISKDRETPTRADDDDTLDLKQESVVCDVNGFRSIKKVVDAEIPTGARAYRAGFNKSDEFICSDDVKEEYSAVSADYLRAYAKGNLLVGTKVSALLSELNATLVGEITSKAVVFSQFLGCLDIIEPELAIRNIKFVRIDRGKEQHEQADALFEFNTDDSVRVLLVSTRCGAVGLNLTAANYCFFMDHMDNASEEKNIGCLHRIGQTRPLTVKRLVIKDTIEERMLAVRENLSLGNGGPPGALVAEAGFFGDDADKKMPATIRNDTDDDKEEEQNREQRLLQRFNDLAKLFSLPPSKSKSK